MRQRVKYPPVFAVAAIALATSDAAAQERVRTIPGPLFGGGWGPPPERGKAPLDPRLPTGAAIAALVERPASHPVCSNRRPVCVHGADGAAALGTLRAIESAYERLVLALGLPAPLSDSVLGGGPDLDAYVADVEGVVVEHDAPDLGERDRASAFCKMGRERGELLERAATLCVGEAIALGLDASESPHTRRAYATHLWHIVGRPTSPDASAIDDAQAQPELSIATRPRTPASEGAALFYDYLDDALGAAEPGALATAMLALSAGKTAPERWEWDNEPDVFDVLRRTYADKPARIADALASFAAARAFVGERDDGAHVPSLAWTGAMGAVRFEWAVKLSSLPRNLAPLRSIEPTGSTYVYVDVDEAELGTVLGFRAEWEPPVAFKWQLVTVDREGKRLATLDVPFQERGTSAEGRLSDVVNAAGVIIVGTNMGGVTLAHPFDPDVEPFEPHEYALLLAKL